MNCVYIYQFDVQYNLVLEIFLNATKKKIKIIITKIKIKNEKDFQEKQIYQISLPS